MFYIIDKHCFPCGHVGVEETPFALCEGSGFFPWQVDEELFFSGDVVGHPVFVCRLLEGQGVLDAPWVEPYRFISRQVPL